MPFDEEDDESSLQPPKVGLKNVSSQKSIFDSMPKKPTQEELNKKVSTAQAQVSQLKLRASELAVEFNKAMADKTLIENKNLFQKDLEKELVSKMIQFAIDYNNDNLEPQDGMGSVSMMILLIRNCFIQRNRINQLEYAISLLEKKIKSEPLDTLKKSE